jgi:sterol desaturase/sphingolipid hydroxylase (fatty acid hydroxylase superfamily)
MSDIGAVQLPDVIGPYLNVYFKQIHHWEAFHVAAFAAVIMFGTEFLSALASLIARTTPKIELNPKLHHDKLSTSDCVFIAVNKVSVVCFTYHLFRVLTMTPSVKWTAEEATLSNSVLVLVPMYIVFDFFYSAWHAFLHWRVVYPYVHKHHHKQVSPTRGHHDAFNVHPLEFVVGEYIHLPAFYLVPCHIFAVLLFVGLGTILATVNHMRFTVRIPGVFDSRDHAVHHAQFNYNFGQYTMFWDKLWGWYKPFDDGTPAKAE